MSAMVSRASTTAVADTAAGRTPSAPSNTGTWDDTYAAAHASAQKSRAQEDASASATSLPQRPAKDSGQQGGRASQAQADPQPAPGDAVVSVPDAPPSRRVPSRSTSDHSPLPSAAPSTAVHGKDAPAPPGDLAASDTHPTQPSNPAAPASKPVKGAPEDSRHQAAKMTARDPADAADVRPTVTPGARLPLARAQTDGPAAEQRGGSGAPQSADTSLHPPLAPQRDRKFWHLGTGQHTAQPPLAATMPPSGNHLAPPRIGVATGQVGASAPAGTRTDHGLVTMVASPVSSVMSAPSPHVSAVHAAASAAEPQMPNQAPQILLQQTAAGLALDKGGTAHVTLHPPTLGRVTVQVTMASSGTAHIQITAATPDGYAALTSSNAALLHHLADKGVTVGSMQMQMQADTGRGGSPGGDQRRPESHQPMPTTPWVPRSPDEAVIAYA